MQLSDKAYNLVKEKYGLNHQNRLTHTLGVAKMASKLANIYNIDEEDAKIASYMHDYCKYDDYSLASNILTDLEYQECLKYPFLFHAYLAAYEYKRLFNGSFKEDIYNAIKYHVFGRLKMSKLEEIIMISDYTEENRTYDSCIKAREILLNDSIEKAIIYSLNETIKHVEKQGDKPHPLQLLIIEEYKNKE